MWRRILALVRKELLALLQDNKSRVVLVVPPIVQVLVFGYAATFDLNHVPFAVYDEDHGEPSRELIARFTGSPSFDAVAHVTSDAEITSLLDRKAVVLVLHIDPRFSRDARRGRSGQVQAIVDGRNSNTAMLTLTYVRQIVADFSEDWAARQGRPRAPARLETRAWFNPNLESQWFFVPGIVGLLTLVVTMLVTALSVAREREQGTFDQLLVTPLRPGEILLGKALPGLLIGLLEATAIVLVATLWFRIPLLGHLWTLYAGLALFLLSAIGVGLMISSLAVTQQQGLLGAFLFLVPSIILSGFATPIANMPVTVQYLTYANPMRYFLIVLRDVFLQGTAFNLLLPQFWPMLAIAAVTLTIAGWLFRHRMY